MEEETNDTIEEEVIEEETPETDLTVETDWEAEAKKARGIAQRLRTKLTKATEKKKETVEPTVEPVKKTQNTGELDETQLDYLDLKGISESEDIEVIQKVIAKTGQTVRQALKDDYVQAKLTANKAERDVRSATPGATRRGGGSSNDLASAIAKYEQTGELPMDFALRSAVVNKMEERTSVNIPPWAKL